MCIAREIPFSAGDKLALDFRIGGRSPPQGDSASVDRARVRSRSVPQSYFFSASKASASMSRFLGLRVEFPTFARASVDSSVSTPATARGGRDRSGDWPSTSPMNSCLAASHFNDRFEQVGDVAQVRDDGRVDRQLDVAERLFARLHAVNEVGPMMSPPL